MKTSIATVSISGRREPGIAIEVPPMPRSPVRGAARKRSLSSVGMQKL